MSTQGNNKLKMHTEESSSKSGKSSASTITNEEPPNKEKIHKETEKKLREFLAKEGKVYPPPKHEASHPIFANDGSFLEKFKKMQKQIQTGQHSSNISKSSSSIGKRRGGKILKTGIVTKSKTPSTNMQNSPNDVWAVYFQEVRKYENSGCDVDSKNRPLVK